MALRIGSGLSTAADPLLAAADAAAQAAGRLGGRGADLAVVFAAGAHVADADRTLEGVHDGLSPDVLIGCAAGGVVAGGREVEDGTAVAVWAASLGQGSASAFHAEVQEIDEGVAVTGMPELDGAGGAILLADPYTFPTDGVLAEVHQRAPGVPVLGGLSSARADTGAGPLFLGERVVDGAVGVRFDGVEVLPCVSQGTTPVGPELTITAADGHVIHELAGRPALEALRAAVEDLPAADRAVVAQGLLLGIVIDSGKPDYEQGDFLVRGLLGGDPAEGSVTVGAAVNPGQIVRLHARDAASADRDLRGALDLRRAALGGERPAGALMFTCNGRGRGMFGVSDHDAGALVDELGDVPAAGFFAAGEIGPVGGQSFLHGFTATVAVFAP